MPTKIHNLTRPENEIFFLRANFYELIKKQKVAEVDHTNPYPKMIIKGYVWYRTHLQDILYFNFGIKFYSHQHDIIERIVHVSEHFKCHVIATPIVENDRVFLFLRLVHKGESPSVEYYYN